MIVRISDQLSIDDCGIFKSIVQIGD